MSAERAIVFTLLCAALTAVMLWLWQANREPMALAGVLFFGSGILVLGSFVFAAPVPAPDIDGSTNIPASAVRCLAMALACATLVVASFIAIPSLSNVDDWRKYVFYVIPVPCAALAIRYFQWTFSRRPAYRLDHHGLTRFHWGERHVAWRDIASVRIWTYRGSRHLVLDLTPQAKRALPWWSRLGSALGGGDLTISALPAGVRTSSLETVVDDYWRRYRG